MVMWVLYVAVKLCFSYAAFINYADLRVLTILIAMNIFVIETFIKKATST